MSGETDLRELIDRVLERIEIESVVGRKVQLKRRGARYVGLCPFHAEKTPSFTVTPDRGRYKCFGCGKSGDAISFLQDTEGLEFWESLRSLADEAGVDLPQRVQRDGTPQVVREGGREALQQARKLYEAALRSDSGADAREYLKNRGIDDELARSFGIGWSPGESGWLSRQLRAKGITPDALEAAGLAYTSDRGGLRDRFWERLMFPISETSGRVVGFGGRFLPGSRAEERQLGKYVNSPDGPFFPKSRLLYGLERLSAGFRDQPDAPILLCEGYLDVVLLHKAGFTTSVAALGTALTSDHARRLRRYDRPVVLVLDPDPAGRKAAARGARLLIAEGVDVRIAELPEGEDPADLVTSGKADELTQRTTQARDIIEWRLDSWASLPDYRVPAVKAKAASEMAEWVSTTPNPALADVWVRLASDRLGVTEESLRRLAPSEGGAAAPAQPQPAPRSTRRDLLVQNEREIAAALLLDPSLLARHRQQLVGLALQDPIADRMLCWSRDRRAEGEAVGLHEALEVFQSDDALPWLASLRNLDMPDPKHVLECALESHPANIEKARIEQRSAEAAALSDEELARYRRTVSFTHRSDTR